MVILKGGDRVWGENEEVEGRGVGARRGAGKVRPHKVRGGEGRRAVEW